MYDRLRSMLVSQNYILQLACSFDMTIIILRACILSR